MPETIRLTPRNVLSRLVPHILEMESTAGGQRIAIGFAGGPGGLTRWRARLLAGVSPVRASTRMGSAIWPMGAERLRSTSTASAFNGDT